MTEQHLQEAVRSAAALLLEHDSISGAVEAQLGFDANTQMVDAVGKLVDACVEQFDVDLSDERTYNALEWLGAYVGALGLLAGVGYQRRRKGDS